MTQRFQIDNNLEGGSALALFLAAAGYAVETRFVDGTVLIAADPVDPQIDIEMETPQALIRQMQERLNDLPDDIDSAEPGNQFHNVA